MANPDSPFSISGMISAGNAARGGPRAPLAGPGIQCRPGAYGRDRRCGQEALRTALWHLDGSPFAGRTTRSPPPMEE
eukprot:10473058-Lingulodinium_polyedra.AAC.1